jgi:hypothetical protein
MKLTLNIPPLQEPLSFDEVKAYLKLTHDAEDELIPSLISSARCFVENQTGCALLKQSWIVELKPPFPTTSPLVIQKETCFEIRLPKPPLLEIKSVESKDTMLSFQMTGDMLRLSDSFWDRDLKITYWAGYGETPDKLPPDLKLATLLTTRFLYDGSTDPTQLLEPYKVFQLI